MPAELTGEDAPMPQMLAVASLAACTCAFAMSAAAQQVSGTLSAIPQIGHRLDRSSEEALLGAVVAALEQRALRDGNFLVVAFEIGPGPHGILPQGGLLAVPIDEKPRVRCRPGEDRSAQCTVGLRASEFRLFTADAGWRWQKLMLHMWEWTGPIEGDRFELALANTDSGAYASPDAFTELVASAFAVAPERVLVRPPTDQEIQMAR